MEAPVEYVNGTVEEQAAPQTLQNLQAAGQDVHTMPVVMGAFQEALAADAQAAANALQAAAGTPADHAMAGGDGTPAMHLGANMSGRGRMSSGSYKNRLGPLFCQVDGCNMPLDNLKEYHQRYKVCEEHLKTPYIIRDGQQVRFCQQCGRFQPLEDFDDNKRSCRVRLQRHNARRRKRPRDGSSGGGDLGDYGAMAGTAAAAAEMAKLASSYAPSIPISPKDMQAMQEALHFASTTLMNSNQVVTGKPAGEEGTDEGGSAGGVGMGAAAMPFVPTLDVMMLLLKGYAAMFHYSLDSATLRALAPPSELPEQQAAAGGGSLGLGAIDALQMQHLMQTQGLFGAPAIPMMLPGADGTTAGMMGAEGQDLAAAAAAAAEAQHAQHAQHAQQEHEGGVGGKQQAHAHTEGVAGAEHQQQEQHVEHAEHAGVDDGSAGEVVASGELTAEQVAAGLMQQPGAGDTAMTAAAALAAAAGGHMPTTTYLTPEQVAEAVAAAQAQTAVVQEQQQAGEDAAGDVDHMEQQ